MTGQPAVKPWHWVLVASNAAAAPLLFAALTFMRPDMVGPMLDHIAGLLIFSVAGLLTVLGAGAVAAVALATRRDGWVLGVWVGSVLTCVFPSVFVLLFGPIVFAFLFGTPP